MIDRRAALRPLAEIVECAFAAGADWLQVRDRELDGRALLALVCELGAAAFRGAAAAARGGADAVAPRILVNRRRDVALAARAALAHEGVDGAAIGVHLGFDAVGVAEARRLVGERALVGVSAHDA
ncbi:MAG: thiamine phosphate synthase, partial [Myxococcales bacterium]|nr:thiamine phosphate synthase [Myxococcales bacterium]